MDPDPARLQLFLRAGVRAVASPSVVFGASSTAICSGLPVQRAPAHFRSNNDHEITRDHLRRIVRAAAERATKARKQADRLDCEAWNTAFRDRRSRHLRWAMRSMPDSISRSEMPWL